MWGDKGRKCKGAAAHQAPYLGIIDVVDLIKDDPLQVPDDIRAAVEHGAAEKG